ncbi:sulfatase family protein [Leifsonia aquatica]|uniref:sulfatase family protein n=1 Tax=Leifsonia aquatica TaxID=144185 RepID=UPI0028A81EE4|nr:sulfatase [Leifsonia aquatica]
MGNTQPDIVLIHCHDLGRWLGTYGMASVPSENIDRFAADAVVFENAHSAAPLCSPARAALFTGISPHRNGVQGLTHDAWRYRDHVLTAPERLRPLGYRSTLIGLQHENVDPTVLGFDECAGLGFLPRVNQVVEATADWLQAVAPAGERQPIFLTVGTWEVHRPWPHEDYVAADPAMVEVPGFLPDNDDTRADIADFYGSIAQFDAGFGALMAQIDAHLDPDHTMVILTTDHGSAFPRAKSTLYDAGTGVTLIVRPPASWGLEPARVRSIATHMDILPTLIDVAGGDPVAELEGQSFRSLLSAPASGDDDRVIFTAKSYHDTYDPKRAARSVDYAYIRNYAEGPKLKLAIDLEKSSTRRGMGDDHLAPRPTEEFYDRRTDPDELDNVADRPEYEEIKATYADFLHEFLSEIHDPIETTPLAPAPPRSRTSDPLPPVDEPSWVQSELRVAKR